MWPASYRPGKAGCYAIVTAVLLTAIGVGVRTIAANRVGTNGNDIQAILKDHVARHPVEVRRFVKDYLVDNPQALQDALVELMQRRAPSAADRTAAITANAAALFNSDRRTVLGNPGGDITLVEFVDYNCGYCRRALADMLDLARTDANLRIVLIEHPVLGPGSIEAARVAIALQMHRDAATYLEFHRRLLAGPGPANKARALAVAAELGLDGARLEAEAARPEVGAILEESRKLARALGLRGTPSYVVGDNVLFGAVGVVSLREKIAAARQK
jgi:protein-disulfide isomerase